jgi:capsid assembly protease
VSQNIADALITEAIETPWAITQPGLATILAVLTRTNVPAEALERDRGALLSNDRNAEVTIRDGVAIVSAAGPMVRRGDFFSRVSSATSYERVAKDLGIALEDPSVRAILLQLDSPGGTVTGVSDLAAMISAGKRTKPIVVHSDGEIASAAYWLASAATEIVASPTVVVGSIGVRMTMKKEKASANDRMVTFEFVSSQSPYKSVDPETDAGRAQIMRTVDALTQVFIETVAANRNASVEKVLSDFGRGDLLVGQAALDAGMIDRLGTFEETLARLASRSTTSTLRVGVPRAMATPPSPTLRTGALMNDNETGAAAQGEPMVTTAQMDAQIAAARTEERTLQLGRVTALLELSTASIEPALIAAIADGTTAEKFAYTQALAAKATKAVASKSEDAAKQQYLEAQKQNEEILAATGVQLPSAKVVDPKPDASEDKKNRLLAAGKRTGALKSTATV